MASTLVFNDIDLMERIPYFLDTIPDLVICRSINKTTYDACANHLEYHTIRCTLKNDDLWRRLIRQPGLARRVRSIEIVPEIRAWAPGEPPKLIIPPSIQSIPKPSFEDIPEAYDEAVLAETAASERLLIEVLKHTKYLTSFDWDGYPPLILPERHDDEIIVDDIWSALQKLQMLRHVRAVDLTVDSYVEEWRCKASPLMVTSGVSFDPPEA